MSFLKLFSTQILKNACLFEFPFVNLSERTKHMKNHFCEYFITITGSDKKIFDLYNDISWGESFVPNEDLLNHLTKGKYYSCRIFMSDLSEINYDYIDGDVSFLSFKINSAYKLSLDVLETLSQELELDITINYEDIYQNYLGECRYVDGKEEYKEHHEYRELYYCEDGNKEIFLAVFRYNTRELEFPELIEYSENIKKRISDEKFRKLIEEYLNNYEF